MSMLTELTEENPHLQMAMKAALIEFTPHCQLPGALFLMRSMYKYMLESSHNATEGQPMFIMPEPRV